MVLINVESFHEFFAFRPQEGGDAILATTLHRNTVGMTPGSQLCDFVRSPLAAAGGIGG